MGFLDSIKKLFSDGSQQAKDALDTNNDGQVNHQDLGGLKDAASGVADVNKDGQVNTQDLGAAKDAAAGAADVNKDGQVNTQDVNAAKDKVFPPKSQNDNTAN